MGNPALQFYYNSAPRAKAGEPGRVACIAITNVAKVFDLTTLTNPSLEREATQTSQEAGALGSFVTIVADGADVGVIFGTAKGDVTGGNVPDLTVAGAVDANGKYTPAAKECFVIKSGTEASFLLLPYRKKGSGATAPLTDRFMGFVGSGAGFMRIYQSSPSGLASSNAPVTS